MLCTCASFAWYALLLPNVFMNRAYCLMRVVCMDRGMLTRSSSLLCEIWRSVPRTACAILPLAHRSCTQCTHLAHRSCNSRVRLGVAWHASCQDRCDWLCLGWNAELLLKTPNWSKVKAEPSTTHVKASGVMMMTGYAVTCQVAHQFIVHSGYVLTWHLAVKTHLKEE